MRTTDIDRARQAWTLTMGRDRATGDEIVFEAGPRIRLEPGTTDEFAEIVISVQSLDSAAEYLEANGLLGARDASSVVIDPSATQGLVLRLVGRE